MDGNKEATKEEDPDRPAHGYEYLDHTVSYSGSSNIVIFSI